MNYRYLMCPPDYFSVVYTINPWMRPKIDHVSDEKTTQWQLLKETFDKLGVEIALLTPQPELPDMVYVDVGVIWKNVFIPSNFKYPERQPERAHDIVWFREHGYTIEEMDAQYSFEGHGDTLWAGDTLFCGYGFRTSIEAHQELRTIFSRLGANVDIVSLEMIDDRFYHLDTCFCPLNEKQALIFRSAFSQETIQMLESRMELFDVSEEDAKKFACNAVVIDKQIIIPEGADATNSMLEKQGFTIHQIPMTEFIKGGGACKCLSMKLN